MKPLYIIDTNILLTACAIQPGERGIQKRDLSPYDVEQGTKSMTPRECRGAVLWALYKGLGIPTLAADEILSQTNLHRRNNEFKPHNLELIKALEQFVLNARFQNRPLLGLSAFESQAKVWEQALQYAKAFANAADPNLQIAGARFLKKNDTAAEFCFDPKKNFDLQLGSPKTKPFIWMDWYLCYAAYRMEAQVISRDRDMLVLNEVFENLYNYRPCVYLNQFRDTAEFDRYKAELKKATHPTPER